MTPERALEIVTKLAEGVDPYTGERLPAESVCQHPDTARAKSPQAPTGFPSGRARGGCWRGGRRWACVFPLQFSPFGNPLS